MKTSITEAGARRFAERAGDAQEFLFCDRIAGLHMKNLQKPGLAAWRYRYTDASGKRRVYTLGKYPAMSPAKAASLALGFQEGNADPFLHRDSQRQEQRRAAARTVAAYLSGSYRLVQSRKRTGEQTLRRITVAFPELLDRPMDSLRPADIRAWQLRREEEGHAYATMVRDFGALKTMLNDAAAEDPPLIDGNPLAKVTLKRPADTENARALAAKRKAERRMLTDDELRGLLTALDTFTEQRRAERANSRAHGRAYLPDTSELTWSAHWFVVFCYVALYTGLRPGDLYTLTWHELNVRFSRLVKVPEKTRDHANPAQVTMTLAEPLRPVIAEWWTFAGKPVDGLVFPSPKGGAQMDRQAHSKPWQAVKKIAALPDALTFYALRHHFISTLVAGGVPIFTVARLAGHKGVGMIESHYGHLSPDAADKAMAIFAQSMPQRFTAGT